MTDIHWRSQSGDGYFNWRIIFDVELPMKKANISFKIMDANILESNEFISEGFLDITRFLQFIYENDLNLKYFKEKKEKFYI